MASDLVEATGESATDNRRVPFSEDMLTAIDFEHMGPEPRSQIDPGAGDAVEVSPTTDQYVASSSSFHPDTMEQALPSDNNLALGNFETPNFQWDEGDIMNGYWQFTSLVR